MARVREVDEGVGEGRAHEDDVVVGVVRTGFGRSCRLVVAERDGLARRALALAGVGRRRALLPGLDGGGRHEVAEPRQDIGARRRREQGFDAGEAAGGVG